MLSSWGGMLGNLPTYAIWVCDARKGFFIMALSQLWFSRGVQERIKECVLSTQSR